MKMSKKRQAIYDKSGGVCWYCGDPLKKGWHADHFKAVRRNDKYSQDRFDCPEMEHPENDTEENKVPSCASCNIMKSQMSIEDFRSCISQFVESLNLYTNQYKFAKRYGLVVETNKPVKFWFEENNKLI